MPINSIWYWRWYSNKPPWKNNKVVGLRIISIASLHSESRNIFIKWNNFRVLTSEKHYIIRENQNKKVWHIYQWFFMAFFHIPLRVSVTLDLQNTLIKNIFFFLYDKVIMTSFWKIIFFGFLSVSRRFIWILVDIVSPIRIHCIIVPFQITIYLNVYALASAFNG